MPRTTIGLREEGDPIRKISQLIEKEILILHLVVQPTNLKPIARMVRITVSGVLSHISFQNLTAEVRCRTSNYVAYSYSVKIRKNNTLLITLLSKIRCMT
jgi:hypothetical protein